MSAVTALTRPRILLCDTGEGLGLALAQVTRFCGVMVTGTTLERKELVRGFIEKDRTDAKQERGRHYLILVPDII